MKSRRKRPARPSPAATGKAETARPAAAGGQGPLPAPLTEDSWHATLFAALKDERAEVAALYRSLETLTAALSSHQGRLLELATRLTKIETDLPDLVNRLLPAVDTLNRLASVGDNVQLKSYQESVQAAARALDRGLVGSGVELIGTVGEIADPDTHSILATRPADDKPEDTVLEVIQRGVRIQGMLLRSAHVVTAVSEPEPTPASGEPETELAAAATWEES